METWSLFKGEFCECLNGYKFFDCVRNKPKTSIRNSVGVGVFIRDKLLKLFSITQIFPYLENCVVLHFKSSCLRNMKDIIIYYIPIHILH